MTRYAYYPGCSLETMAATYHVSSMEVAHKLGVELEETTMDGRKVLVYY